MSEPTNTAAATAKTVLATGSGFVVWGLSLNEIAAILSIVLLVTTICEKWGITGWVQSKIAALVNRREG